LSAPRKETLRQVSLPLGAPFWDKFMWFFATLLEALKGFLVATSSTILYPGDAMSKRPVLLNQILLIIIILLASCDGTIRSKSDVEELCQAGEYEQLYEWITKTISSSSVIEIQTQEPQLEDAITCLINHYRFSWKHTRCLQSRI